MSIAALNWAWDQDCPSIAVKCLLVAMADNANDAGECWPGIPNLVKKTSSTARSVHRYIDELVALNLIRKEARHRKDGGQTSNLYYLQMGVTRQDVGLDSMPGDPESGKGSNRRSRTAKGHSGAAADAGNRGGCQSDRGGDVNLTGGGCQSDRGGANLTGGGVSLSGGGLPTCQGGGASLSGGGCHGDTPMNHHMNHQGTTTTTTTPPTAETDVKPSPAGPAQNGSSCFSDTSKTSRQQAPQGQETPPTLSLVIPDNLSEIEKQAAAKVLASAGPEVQAQAQDLLWELGGQVASKRRLAMPINTILYLHGLIRAATAGVFTLAAGLPLRTAHEHAIKLKEVNRRNEAAALADLQRAGQPAASTRPVPVPAPGSTSPRPAVATAPAPRPRHWRKEIADLRAILKGPSAVRSEERRC